MSGESLAGPNEGVYTTLYFDSTNYFSIGDGYTISVFDDNGTALEDGIGYLIIHDIIGSFELNNVTVAGRFYDGGVTDTTAYLSGTISSSSTSPDLSSAIATSHLVLNTLSDTVAIAGIDIVFPEPTTPIPEPSTLLLIDTGLVGLAGFRRKFKN